MSELRGLFAMAALLVAAQFALADCGKIPIIPCPPPTPPDVLIEQLSKQPGNSTIQGNPTGGEAATTTGDSGEGATTAEAGDGTVSPRGYFTEPAQRAVIAWNGKQQIMVLQTEEYALAKKGGAMLSFLPLPGKPIAVREADNDFYDRAFNQVRANIKKDGVDIGDGSRNKVVLSKEIGAHNIFVWKCDNINAFANSVQSYINRRFKGKAVAVITKDTERVARQYFSEGFRYFAFDLIHVAPEQKGKQWEKKAIEYQFESQFVYFPLRVSQSGGTGDTRVELVVFTHTEGVNFNKGKLKFADEKTNLPPTAIMTMGKKATIMTNKQLQGLHKGMASLFDGKDVKARVWVLRGPINGFDGDIQASKR